MRKLFIGIDPGKTGAIGFIESDTLNAYSEVLKFNENDFDDEWLRNLIKEKMKGFDITILALEKVNGDNGLSGSAMFNWGFTCGQIRSAVVKINKELGVRLIYVQPRIWQKKVLIGTGKTKDESVRFVRSFYPMVQLIPPRGRNPDHNKADSVCLAHYCLLMYGDNKVAAE